MMTTFLRKTTNSRTTSVPTSMIPTILRRKKTTSKGWDNRCGRIARSMKPYLPLGIVAALLLAALVLLTPAEAQSTQQLTPNVPVEVAKPTLTHAQEVWISALEWCESRGKPTAINKVDRDGTPSYYSFQFKPSTFDMFAAKYGIEGTIDSHAAQRAIVEAMVLDPEITDAEWRDRQFPDCISRKIGLPPRY